MMTLSQACRSCSVVKAIDSYERLPSGGRRGTCIACRRAVSAAAKLRARESRTNDPAHLARIAQRDQEKARRAAFKEAEKAALLAEREAHREACRDAARLKREERKAALRDDIWSAMRRGRARRALQTVSEHPSGTHRIKLRNGQGYISVAEMACRYAEREACYRAAASCKSYESASDASRILEQPTPSVDRSKELRRLWWTDQPQRVPGALQLTPAQPESDPFEEAFGDWAPAGMRGEWFATCLA